VEAVAKVTDQAGEIRVSVTGHLLKIDVNRDHASLGIFTGSRKKKAITAAPAPTGGASPPTSSISRSRVQERES